MQSRGVSELLSQNPRIAAPLKHRLRVQIGDGGSVFHLSPHLRHQSQAAESLGIGRRHHDRSSVSRTCLAVSGCPLARAVPSALGIGRVADRGRRTNAAANRGSALHCFGIETRHGTRVEAEGLRAVHRVPERQVHLLLSPRQVEVRLQDSLPSRCICARRSSGNPASFMDLSAFASHIVHVRVRAENDTDGNN